MEAEKSNQATSDAIRKLTQENDKLKQQIALYKFDIKATQDRLQEEIKKLKEENEKLKLPSDIPYYELTLGERIGAGGYGEVFKAQWHSQNVAVKGIKVEDIETGKINNLVHEARTIMRLHHKHVVLSMGTAMKPDTTEIMLVMEYMKHGSLEDLLFKQHVKLQRAQIVQLALDVAKGLNYLHCLTPKIIHRDLKCANILLYHNKTRAKISDFGTARYLNKNSLAKTCDGVTIGYVAPEILEEQSYDDKADIYSFGIVLLVLATSRNNLPTTRNATELRDKVSAMLESSSSMSSDSQFRDLVLRCCQFSPADRPSMKYCVEVLKNLRQKYSSNNK